MTAAFCNFVRQQLHVSHAQLRVSELQQLFIEVDKDKVNATGLSLLAADLGLVCKLVCTIYKSRAAGRIAQLAGV